MITVFSPLTTTASEKTADQATGETRFVVDCKWNPAASAGHVKITYAAEGVIVSCGGGNEILNTVPLPEVPP